MARFTKFIVGAAGIALALTGCASNTTNSPSPSTDDTVTTVKAGYLTMCSDSPYPPFEYEDDTTATGYTGFDVDIMSAIASQLGLKLSVIDTDFSALQSGLALASGSCDVGGSAITITDERKANIDFSDPYYDSLQSLLVPVGSSIKALADTAGKKIGVQTGTTGETYTEQNAPSSASIVTFPSDGEMWPALQAGQVDALLQDYPVNNQHVKDNSSYVIVEKYQTDEQYGFAVAKGKNPALLAAINSGLADLRSSGDYQTIYDKYFS
ncbi:MAG: ABC transporter substrate-binding protein [Propionibacteriaceae bacterium]|nr:ABC transporter substrate-binding protein [Propionibacteriaceae bacterium]